MTNTAQGPTCNPRIPTATLIWWFLAALAWTALTGPLAHSQTLSTLYSFQGKPDGSDPSGALIRDAVGNLYGVTVEGGSTNSGTVFKVDQRGKETVLYSFTGSDGLGAPLTSLVRDSAGNLYGTVAVGGASQYGAVYEISESGTATIIYSFKGPDTGDGQGPAASVILGKPANLYGTTYYGGSGSCQFGCGIVFKVTKGGKETILHSFTGAAVDGDGAYPRGSLVQDAAGNLYGTTFIGGDPSCGNHFGCGTVFKIDTAGVETVLHRFSGTAGDGAFPYGSLLLDTAGNIYGTTSHGGSGSCSDIDGPGCGTVFKLSASGEETVLHSFAGGEDGQYPVGGLLRDKTGDLFGTTLQGGDPFCNCGTVFKVKVSRAARETVLYRPTLIGGLGALVQDAAGNFYGSNPYNGSRGFGLVFKLTP